MNKAKIDKYIEYLTTKMKLLYREKKLNFEGHDIKYVLEKNKNSDDLIVVFSGIPRPGIKARYNYMRTLEKVNVNKLYILDDLGFDQRGGYYLGKNKEFYMERAVLKLINEVKKKNVINRTIYCGSSKGGWAAIYFGIRDYGSTIIAGSLQYVLGDYVTSNERIKENLMKFIMGENYTNKDIDFLNSPLSKTIQNHNNNKNDIWLHYSDSEYTYDDHMVYLLEDLKKLNMEYSEDVAHYEKHGDLSLHFPPFLINTLKKIVRNDS